MKNECCHQHPDNGDLALQTEAQRAETDLRDTNAQLLAALEQATLFIEGVFFEPSPLLKQDLAFYRAAIEEAKK